jgi:hypothetical protein
MSTADGIAAVAALALSVVSIGLSVWTMLVQRQTRRLREIIGEDGDRR